MLFSHRVSSASMSRVSPGEKRGGTDCGDMDGL
jgi:hypothetical protein